MFDLSLATIVALVAVWMLASLVIPDRRHVSFFLTAPLLAALLLSEVVFNALGRICDLLFGLLTYFNDAIYERFEYERFQKS